jgi:DNA-binding transcriptional MocR family regulator
MTIWKPALSRTGVRHQAIVEALARDILAGVLKPGDRLPTHRDLAEKLGLAIGTVSRAYDEAKRRGLVQSTVGRGTYIKGHPLLEHRQLRRDTENGGKIDLSFNGPVISPGHGDAFQRLLASLADAPAHTGFLDYHRPWLGRLNHRRAGAKWIRRLGLDVEAEDVAIVAGAQHAASVALLSVAAAGDVVVSDQLTDPVMKLLVAALGLELKGLKADADGMLPDAFESACRHHDVKVLFCAPDHHSPTLTVMSEERRRAIAGIARKHGVVVLENAVYRPFLKEAPPALSSFAPERSYYFTSLSKIIAPGLRIGFLAAPPGKADELVLGLGATIWMAPPITAEMACQWIEDGTAEQLANWQRAELAARNKIAAQTLERFQYTARESGLHVWLQLPAPWRSATFVREARARHVLVTPADVYATEQHPVPQAVRISLGGAVESRDALRDGLSVLGELLGRRVDASLLSM